MDIFISHISEEAPIASVLKEWIRTTFGGKYEVFVSSDGDKITAGTEWIRVINKALNSSKILLVLCSPISIKRPWINIEAGCGWIKRIPIIPICHSGQFINQLPPPYNEHHALELLENKFPEKLFGSLKQHLDVKMLPRIKYDEMRMELDNAQKEVEDKIGLIQGIKVFQIWKSEELYKAIENATPNSRIRILQTWFPDREKICRFFEDLLIYKDRKFSFEILLMDKGEVNPSNDVLDARMMHRSEDRKYARDNIDHTINRLIEMKKKVDKEWKEKDEKLKLEIRSYNFLPFGPIYQIDKKYIFAGFFINNDSSINAPMIVVQDPNSEIWKIFENNFEVEWEKEKNKKILFKSS